MKINIYLLCRADSPSDMLSGDLVSEELQQNVVRGFMEDDLSDAEVEVSINCIPDEILEYIILQTSPYCDFKSALLVSKRWYSVTKSAFAEIRCFII